MSEPGSVPDGETLQNADVARLKRRSWDTEIIGGYPRKRYGDGFSFSQQQESICNINGLLIAFFLITILALALKVNRSC